MYDNGNETNTGHNEVISFDFVVKKKEMYMFIVRQYVYILDIDNEAFRLILSVAFLYLED